MARFYLIAGMVVLGWFNYAQYSGWSLFADDANVQPFRSADAARAYRYHK